MKRTIVLGIIIALLIVGMSWAQTPKQRMAKIFDVRGMSSPMCELAINGALGSMPGIDRGIIYFT